MKKYLILLTITLTFCFESSIAQGIYNIKTNSSYSRINIESSDSYRIRKSHDYNITYSTYNGPKSYVAVDFIKNNDDFAYTLCKNGRIYDYINNTEGNYFVADEVGYKIYKVYIRWDHGGETWGTLNYSRRSDGRPKFRINFNGHWYNYSPYTE